VRALRLHDEPVASVRPTAAPPTSISVTRVAGTTESVPSSIVSLAKTTPPPSVTAAPSKPPTATGPVRRTVKLNTNLQNGVLVAVDGDPAGNAAGASLTIDDKKHTIELTCVNNMCEPLVRDLPPGDKDTTLDLVVKVRDARVVIDGDPVKHYGLLERGLDLPSGVPVSVPMKLGLDYFTVTERESGRVKRVALTAGKELHVTFEEP
jgi:hypothetical protein